MIPPYFLGFASMARRLMGTDTLPSFKKGFLSFDGAGLPGIGLNKCKARLSTFDSTMLG